MVLRPGVRTALFVCCFAAVGAAQQDRIPGPIDGNRTMVMRGTVPARTRMGIDRGAVEPEFRLGNITLMLRPSAAQQAALEQLLAEQHDANSPNYHQWLTADEYASRFGASAADLDKISGWLRSAGFAVSYTARGRDVVSFSGTASQVRAALHSEIHRYEIAGKTHFANAADLSLPAAIAPLVGGILGLNDFHPRAPRKTRQANYTDGTGEHLLLPDDVAAIYDVVPLYGYGYTGAGQSIVIVGQSDIDPSDIAAFRSAWDLPATSIQMVTAGEYPGFSPDDEGEADLDLEWAGAVARDAKLIFVFGNDADYASFYAIDNNLAPVISESFGLCEAQAPSVGPAFSVYETEVQKGNALGITWLASSGDSGAAGCDYDEVTATQGLAVSLPASVPEVTAVGGTEFNEQSGVYWNTSNGPYGGSAISYIPEMSWNDTGVAEALLGGLSASGGGLSSVFKKPSWQSGPGVPSDGARDVPDISLNASDAHDPYVIISQGVELAVGGTSASSPTFAGMLALLNQFLVQNNVQSKPGLGNLNQKLYSMAASAKPGVFHDVTVGTNIVPCQTGTPDCTNGHFGYSAGPGYDLVTGLGSVDAYHFITAYAGLPVVATTAALSATQTSILRSGYTVLTATIKAAGGSLTPTGAVSFTLGSSPLGSAVLSGSGATATASLTVYGSQLPEASNTVSVYYGGSPTFTSSSAQITLTLGSPVATSKVTASATPNPVYQHAADKNGAAFTFSIQLQETAGVSTTVTGMSFGGVSYNSSIATFFGSTTLPAHGSLTASLSGANIAVPSTVPVVFTGRDASGATWTQQLSISFLPAPTGGQ